MHRLDEFRDRTGRWRVQEGCMCVRDMKDSGREVKRYGKNEK